MYLPQQTQDSTRAGFTSVLIPLLQGPWESSFKYIWQIDFKEYKPRQKEIQDFTDILRQNTSIYKGYTINKIHTVKHRWGQEQRLLAQMTDWCDKIKAYVP